MTRLVLALSTAAVLTAATPALACLPALERTAEEQARLNLQSQTYAWEDVDVIYEARVVEAYTTEAERVPGEVYMPMTTLHVRFEPVRVLRGTVEPAMIEFAYPNGCGIGFEGPTEPGARYILYADAPADRMTSVQELFPLAEIIHPETLALIAVAD